MSIAPARHDTMTPCQHSYLDNRVRLVLGDLTEQTVDVIVNAANSSLLGGGGVDGAIHRAGGPTILEACQALRQSAWPDGLPTGEVAITSGGKLAAPYVIHTVGPIYGQHHGDEAALLAACYRKAIELASRLDLKRIAFPAISTGVYGYPPGLAAPVVSNTLTAALASDVVIDEVRLVFFNIAQLEEFVAHQKFPR